MSVPEEGATSDAAEALPGATSLPVKPLPRLPVLRPAPDPPPKPRRRVWPGIAAVLVLAALIFLLLYQPWVPRAVRVVVEIAAEEPVTRVLAVNGRVAALVSVDVRPLVAGTLAEVRVDEGDAVAAGAVLARIDAQGQEAVVRQAVAGLDAALLARDEAQAASARAKALGSNVSRTALENAARAAQSAEQEVARMKALLDQASVQLGNYTLRAPMAGTVLSLSADPGQSVDVATSLMTIADLSGLVVETDVDEAYAATIREGQPVTLKLSGEATLRQGRVSFVSRQVDEATGGLAVRLVPDKPLAAPVGLTVTANIVIEQRAAALTVPRTALVARAEGPVGLAVFVVEEGVARKRAVEVIDWPAARLIVNTGLRPGDAVIADATGLADGAAVTVVRP